MRLDPLPILETANIESQQCWLSVDPKKFRIYIFRYPKSKDMR